MFGKMPSQKIRVVGRLLPFVPGPGVPCCTLDDEHSVVGAGRPVLLRVCPDNVAGETDRYGSGELSPLPRRPLACLDSVAAGGDGTSCPGDTVHRRLAATAMRPGLLRATTPTPPSTIGLSCGEFRVLPSAASSRLRAFLDIGDLANMGT